MPKTRAETMPHRHAAYSSHGGQFRCLHGAVAYSGAGPWTVTTTRGCAVCAAPTDEPGQQPLCTWHRSIGSDLLTIEQVAKLISDAGVPAKAFWDEAGGLVPMHRATVEEIIAEIIAELST